MAKKATGPKEAQLRAMREHRTAAVEIDRHALQEARAAARAKANDLYKKEMASIVKPLDDQMEKMTARKAELLDELNGIERDLLKIERAKSDVLGLEPPANGSGRKGSGGRIRRSPDQLKDDAAKIVAHLKANPGSKAGDIAKATGVNFKPSLSDFLDKQGIKVKTEGHKASTRYQLA